MDYEEIAAHFLTYSPAPTPVLPTSPARRLRDSVEAIATIGWWSRSAADSANALGHDFFDAYVWGRAASLGADVSAPVVVAAFGVFEAGLLGACYERARQVSSRDAVLAARSTGAAAGLAHATAGVDVQDIKALGLQLLAALGDLDVTARPLFGALRALTVPPDPHGRLWRAAELVREHRGDGHLAACVAAGLDPVEMNILTEVWLEYPVGEYSSTRGFSKERIALAVANLQARGWMTAEGTLSDEGRAGRENIEWATDRSQQSFIDALGSAVEDVIRMATVVSDAVVLAHAAPADPRKRAAG